jgi:hypothetical protein
MPLPPHLAAILLLPVLAACAVQPAGPDPALMDLVARLPQSAGNFTLTESQATAASPPNWRAIYQHAASGSVAVVLIGSPGQPPLPTGPDSDAVRTVTNAQALMVQAALGGGGLTRSPDFGAGISGQPPEIRCSDLQAKPSEGPITRTLSCNTGVGGGLVSVSVATRHPQEAADNARLFMVSFALRVTRALRGAEPETAAPTGATPAEPAAGGRIFRL